MSRENTKLQKQRVWEIDAYRGYRMLLLLALHLYFTVDEFCIDGYYNIDSYRWVAYTDPLHLWFDWGADGIIYKSFMTEAQRGIWVQVGLAGFFFVSGICCSFSRSNWNRILRYFLVGFLISAFTFGLYLWTGEERWFIRFGAILSYACCHLIYAVFLEKKSNPVVILAAIPPLAGGYFLLFHPVYTDMAILYPFGFLQNGLSAGGYVPILPYLGWLLLGVVWGRKFYADKKSLIPLPTADRLTRPLQWLGRYSGVIFALHIVIYTAFFCSVGYIFHLF